jgi:hypothetical protein
LDGDDGENVDGFFNGEVTLMLLNLCCTGVKLAVALALTGDGFAGTGSSSSLISTTTINKRQCIAMQRCYQAEHTGHDVIVLLFNVISTFVLVIVTITNHRSPHKFSLLLLTLDLFTFTLCLSISNSKEISRRIVCVLTSGFLWCFFFIF